MREMSRPSHLLRCLRPLHLADCLGARDSLGVYRSTGRRGAGCGCSSSSRANRFRTRSSNHSTVQQPPSRGVSQRAGLRLARGCAAQDRTLAAAIQSRTATFESRLPGAGRVRGKEQTTEERAHRAHRLASTPPASRRGAHAAVSVEEPDRSSPCLRT